MDDADSNSNVHAPQQLKLDSMQNWNSTAPYPPEAAAAVLSDALRHGQRVSLAAQLG